MAGERRTSGIVTPEAVLLEFETAGVGSRGVARLVDLVVQVLVFFVLSLVASMVIGLAIIVNLHWLAMLLYADAFVSPSGTGITYTASTGRMIFGMQKNGTLPKVLGKLHPVYGVPRPAMWFNLVVSFLFLFFFRGWGKLAAVISVATIISYMTGPVSAIAAEGPQVPAG